MIPKIVGKYEKNYHLWGGKKPTNDLKGFSTMNNSFKLEGFAAASVQSSCSATAGGRNHYTMTISANESVAHMDMLGPPASKKHSAL